MDTIKKESKMKDNNYKQASDITVVEETIEHLTRYYEVDIDNCKMTHKMWILELAKCMLLPDKYKSDFYKEIKEYDEERIA